MSSPDMPYLRDLLTNVANTFKEIKEYMEEWEKISNEIKKAEEKQRTATPQPTLQYPPLMIGITGRARSGKDTTAKAIMKLLELPAHILPLAESLKQDTVYLLRSWCDSKGIVSPTYEELREILDGMWKEHVGRPLYQGLGEFARVYATKHYWTNIVQNFTDEHPNDIILIPDVRYPVEATWIRNQKRGVLIGLEADRRTPGELQFARHSSEVEIDQCIQLADSIIDARVTLEELPEVLRKYILPHLAGVYKSKNNGGRHD